MSPLHVIGFACLGITLVFWLIVSIGVRHSPTTSVGDFMLVGTISMIPLFFAICAFLL